MIQPPHLTRPMRGIIWAAWNGHSVLKRIYPKCSPSRNGQFEICYRNHHYCIRSSTHFLIRSSTFAIDKVSQYQWGYCIIASFLINMRRNNSISDRSSVLPLDENHMLSRLFSWHLLNNHPPCPLIMSWWMYAIYLVATFPHDRTRLLRSRNFVLSSSSGTKSFLLFLSNACYIFDPIRNWMHRTDWIAQQQSNCGPLMLLPMNFSLSFADVIWKSPRFQQLQNLWFLPNLLLHPFVYLHHSEI